ncbi:MAG: hypothetical protein JO368_09550 [Acidimicrobiales bacterium]|nr:hypothetical protein [Acidimicrobiales bacterium]
MCGEPTRFGRADCFCCATLASQLGTRLVPVIATFDYVVGDRQHRLLRGYKDGPQPLRGVRASALARRLGDWLTSGGGDALFGGWDVVTTVPSSRRGGAPAEAIASRVPELHDRLERLLVRGPDSTDHLRAARRGFLLSAHGSSGRARGARILLFDDSITTGARAQSAAYALGSAGHPVVGILAVGRARRAAP